MVGVISKGLPLVNMLFDGSLIMGVYLSSRSILLLSPLLLPVPFRLSSLSSSPYHPSLFTHPPSLLPLRPCPFLPTNFVLPLSLPHSFTLFTLRSSLAFPLLKYLKLSPLSSFFLYPLSPSPIPLHVFPLSLSCPSLTHVPKTFSSLFSLS